MSIRQIGERVQLISAAGTEQKVYEAPAGEVLIISKLAAVNTNTSANCVVNVWIDQDGGSSVAPGDVSHFVVDEPVSMDDTVPFPAAGINLAPGGQIYASVATPAGANFQSSVNIIVSGVLVSQARKATGTSA